MAHLAADTSLVLQLNFTFTSWKSSLAQLAERKTVNLEAVSSILTGRVYFFVDSQHRALGMSYGSRTVLKTLEREDRA
jgi:hypothetical protein